MTFDAVLSVISFAISLGGFVPLLFLRNERKKVIVLTVLVAALAVSTGLTYYGHRKTERLIAAIQSEIAGQLASGPLTFDEIYIRLHFRPFPLVTEALFRSVEQGAIKQKQIDLFRDGVAVPAKAYYR